MRKSPGRYGFVLRDIYVISEDMPVLDEEEMFLGAVNTTSVLRAMHEGEIKQGRITGRPCNNELRLLDSRLYLMLVTTAFYV